MKTKVCPCCDQPMKGIYCKGCRKIVLKPVQQNIQYYLNTRHPEYNHGCTFHDDKERGSSSSARANGRAGDGAAHSSEYVLTAGETEAKKAEIKERMQKRKREQQRSTSSRSSSVSQATHEKGNRNALITAIVMVLVIFTIAFMIIMINLVNTTDGFTTFGVAEAVPEPIKASAADMEIELPVPGETDASQMEDWELTDAEVKENGVACNGFGHFPVVFDDVDGLLSDCISDAGYNWMMSVYSYNQFIDSYTWYETVYEYTIRNEEEYAGFLNIDVDTVTGEIHGIEMYTHYEKGFFEVADIAMKFMEAIGMATDLPEGIEFFEEAYKNQGEDGFCMQNGLEVVCHAPEADEERGVYQMAIYVQGYYTVQE